MKKLTLFALLLTLGAGAAEHQLHLTPDGTEVHWTLGDVLHTVHGTFKLRRGDIVFWKGHVAIVRDAAMLLHANAHHMAVAIEPIAEAVRRIAAAGSAVTTVKRLQPP